MIGTISFLTVIEAVECAILIFILFFLIKVLTCVKNTHIIVSEVKNILMRFYSLVGNIDMSEILTDEVPEEEKSVDQESWE